MPDFEENVQKEKTQQSYHPRGVKGSSEKPSSQHNVASSTKKTRKDPSTNLRGRWKSSSKKAPRTEEPNRPKPIAEKRASSPRPKRSSEGEREKALSRGQKSHPRHPSSQQRPSLKDKERNPSRTRSKSSQKQGRSSQHAKDSSKKSVLSTLLTALRKLLGLTPPSKKGGHASKQSRYKSHSQRSKRPSGSRSYQGGSREGHSKTRSSAPRSSHSKSVTDSRNKP